MRQKNAEGSIALGVLNRTANGLADAASRSSWTVRTTARRLRARARCNRLPSD